MIKQELLQALELDEAGEWDEAHSIVQQYSTPEANWIHAYLHRKEGDRSNAMYWYSIANRDFPKISLEREWKIIFEFVEKIQL
jgi:hypothetical protein